LTEPAAAHPVQPLTSRRVARVAGYVLLALCFFAAGFMLAPLPEDRDLPAVSLDRVKLPRPVPVKEFALDVVDGNVKSGAYTRERLLNQWTLMYFGYTNCPDVCRPTLAVLAEVGRRLRAAPQWTARLASSKLELVFVTVDPSRDTAAAVRDFLAATDAGIVGLRGSEGQIANLAQQLGIMSLPEPADPQGRYLIDHPATILFIGPGARLRAGFSMPRDADQVTELVSEIATQFEAEQQR
jgi:protein SCO1/2